MKNRMLVLGLFLLVAPAMADVKIKSDTFNVTYDEVSDVTTISHKDSLGDLIPGTGDVLAGHMLYFNVQIRFRGKKYNPADTENTKVVLFFIERSADSACLYENQDDIILLIDGARVDLGKADYALNGVAGDVSGVQKLEILSLPVDVALLTRLSTATKVEGSITPEKANGLGPFTFGYSDFTLAKNALILLNALKNGPAVP